MVIVWGRRKSRVRFLRVFICRLVGLIPKVYGQATVWESEEGRMDSYVLRSSCEQQRREWYNSCKRGVIHARRLE